VNEEPQDEQREAPPKKPYAAPRLIEYGPALDLVGGGTGTVPEGGTGASMKHP
jgi:hypothetical protein